METLVFLTIRKTAGEEGHDEDHAKLATFARSKFTQDIPSDVHSVTASDDNLSSRWGETVKSKFEGKFFDFLRKTEKGETDYCGFSVKVSHHPFHGKLVHDLEYWSSPYQISISWIQ